MKVNSQALRRLRRERGWSLEQLAENADVAYTTVRAMEAPGAHESTVKKVADALGVPVAALDGDLADDQDDDATVSVGQ